jgi:chemotaxis protein MotB
MNVGQNGPKLQIGMIKALRHAILAFLLTSVVAAGAQETATPEPTAPSFDEVQATIKRMQDRLERLGGAAAERDQALRFLAKQVEQATGEIAGTGKTNESLTGQTAVLSKQLQDLSRARDALQGEVGERGAALTSLESQVATLTSELGKTDNARSLLAQELETARTSLAAATARQGELEAKVASLESGASSGAAAAAEHAAEAERLRQRVAALETAGSASAKEAAERVARAEAAAAAQAKAVDGLRVQLSALQLVAGDQAKSAAQRAAEADGLRQRVAELEAATGDSAKEAADKIAKAEAAAAAQAKAVEDLRAQLSGLQLAAGNEAKSAADRLAAAADEARTREAAVADLHGEADGLKREVFRLNELLAAAETKVDTQQEKIEGLDAELGQALARKVEELEKYRSEFFGRLREALGDRPDLRVVGDRFVFQSELLFASGSATLDPEGQGQLRQLAHTLQEVAASIPPELDWVLRVDGHTDRQPIRDATFRSNWELSTARAISVIEFLIDQGIPPQHLAAAGFGEYRPIDTRDDEAAYRRNRRIEFKLTEG